MKKSKKDYYSSYFEESKQNMTKTWKGIKELVNTNNNLSTNVTQLKANNSIIDDPQLISDTFNNFVANVGPNTNNTIPNLGWFTSYLNGRSQYVSCNNTTSEIKPIGSVLGPLLFLLNDLLNVSNKLSCYLFADTNIFFESDNLGTLQKTVHHELKKTSHVVKCQPSCLECFSSQ